MSLEDTTANLKKASDGFDQLFANDLEKAHEIFKSENSPFHMIGVGICAFLEAALGMEAGVVAEAAKSLAEAENAVKAQLKTSKYAKSNTRFPAGTEYELLHSDAVILHGITHALSESYMGYAQCLYAMNSAHSKFTKLYKTVYPNGLDNYATPSSSTPSSRPASIHSQIPSTNPTTTVQAKPKSSGLFSRFGSSLSVPSPPVESAGKVAPDGPLEELIMSGAAFGYGMFNLVFSLLPAGIRGVVGFLGFKHDRKLALRALAVSAAQKDVHSVFAGLTLMTYYGVVLLLSGYQADEQHILKQYKAIVDNIDERYPTGSLWILNRAKILRMSGDTPGAIDVLQAGLQPDRPHTFAQADSLLIFELAWTLLSQRRYLEAADTFLRMTEVNSWSHATYYFIAAGCHISLKNYEKAQTLFDAIPDLLDKKKIGGKDLPTEVFIKKRLRFYQDKQKRLTGSTDNWAHCICISPAEELSIFWNTHARISKEVAQEHIAEFAVFTPAIQVSSPLIPKETIESTPGKIDLDTPDEIVVRALLLGVLHRTVGEFGASRAFLLEAKKTTVAVNTWVAGVATFELAVLELKETEAKIGSDLLVLDEEKKIAWRNVIKSANEKLNEALSLAPQSVDLSSRLDMRVAMLRDEIGLKKEAIDGVV
ncbi:outer membrane protein Iml2/Tetratricopeptide repeat protein 39 [Cristinia sonorae]|uniref:Outer membrane protein Iml2/Tetratricopeptide repeat protein 39 n=1 Tax=Cristinia sonorae TaxID=1940300 RepID=A0A8K0UX19_9AGAR|nr:outer membrane protein Iml2/Tetratricopeptide repeat protein 39 [Cristinia sonorae]